MKQASVGLPVLKLDRQNHFGKGAKNCGNCRAVLMEMLEERQSSDNDLDRSMTQNNQYYKYGDMSYKNGAELADMLEDSAAKFRTRDKNGKEKQLRSDANIAFAGIIKPDKEFMDSLTAEEQHKFLTDALTCVSAIFSKRKMTMLTAVMHVDEGNPHVHYAGYDPAYKLGKKIDLKLFEALHHTEFPQMMENKGWHIKPPENGYKEATQGMSADELEEYKQNKRNNKSKNGRKSKEYKADKEREKQQQLADYIKQQEETVRRNDETIQQQQSQIAGMRTEIRELENKKDELQQAPYTDTIQRFQNVAAGKVPDTMPETRRLLQGQGRAMTDEEITKMLNDALNMGK